MSEQICGRAVTVIKPGSPGKKLKKFQGEPHAKFVVDGISHPKGLPIKFHSRQRAENHIRNIGKAMD